MKCIAGDFSHDSMRLSYNVRVKMCNHQAEWCSNVHLPCLIKKTSKNPKCRPWSNFDAYQAQWLSSNTLRPFDTELMVFKAKLCGKWPTYRPKHHKLTIKANLIAIAMTYRRIRYMNVRYMNKIYDDSISYSVCFFSFLILIVLWCASFILPLIVSNHFICYYNDAWLNLCDVNYFYAINFR